MELPNKLPADLKDKNGKIKKTVGVCYKHFPTDCPMKVQRGGCFVPTESSLIFGKTDGSLFAQTTPKILRKPNKRNVTAELRVDLAL